MPDADSPLKAFRRRLKMTQAQLSDAAGVSQGHISDVECGHSPIDPKLKSFLQKLHQDTDDMEQRQLTYMKESKARTEEAIIREADAQYADS